ncbi:Response regulator receiver domain-containing protein [Siphonobacter aquaeclarae]|jgi:CheY-like chemotaxis protein|uniref:Response regulator receiver domain-containing protein n=2 Tax=Siphonobacter aquaeclarae TaxID=563176 RepID=A0A1G9L3N6_9BACT|nr:Response regulator receiver domain-containing protein [Siphonobacter aquaeclarae]
MSMSSPDHVPDLNEFRVLLVDDNRLNLQILKKLLTRAQAEVETADGGQDAVAFAREHSFRFILMDYQMPDLDGFEAAQQIRAFDPAVPIYLMSGDDVPPFVRDSGVITGTLLKPVQLPSLLALVGL